MCPTAKSRTRSSRLCPTQSVLTGHLWIAKGPNRLQAVNEDFDAQADLILRWAHTQFCRKCCVPAQIVNVSNYIMIRSNGILALEHKIGSTSK